jgi:hypothetical protein
MFLDALGLIEKKSTLNTVFRYLALALLLLVIGGTLYGWLTEGMDQSNIARLVRNLISASIFGYYFFSPIIARKRAAAILFRAGPERTIQGNVNLEGISIGPKDNRTIKWDRFVSKGERDKLFALMTVEGFVAVFHKDFFATENDWHQFRRWANQRVIEPK